jgi:hypothetical protein
MRDGPHCRKRCRSSLVPLAGSLCGNRRSSTQDREVLSISNNPKMSPGNVNIGETRRYFAAPAATSWIGMGELQYAIFFALFLAIMIFQGVRASEHHRRLHN